MRQTHSKLCFGLLIACVVLCASAGPVFAAMVSAPAAGAGSAVLVLDGTPTGTLSSLSGGAITAEVLTAKTPGNYPPKQLGSLDYEPITFVVGLDRLSSSLRGWIADAWSASQKPKNGSVVFSDGAGKAVSELQFVGAVISEVSIPFCDGTSHAYPEVSVVITSRATRQAPPTQTTGYRRMGYSLEYSSFFILHIDGLDCKGVIRIEQFTVQQPAVIVKVEDDKGVVIRLPQPSKANFPNLKITLRENWAQSWRDWANDFLIKGKSEQSSRKNGYLSFFADKNLSGEIARINLYNLGICRLGPVPVEGNGEGVGKLVAEIYCERMEFCSPGTAAPASGTSAPPPTGTRPIGTR